MKGVKLETFKLRDWKGQEATFVRRNLRFMALDPMSFLEGEITVGMQYDCCDFEPVLRIRSIADAVIEGNRNLGDDDPLTLLDAGIDWLLRETMKLQQERCRLHNAAMDAKESAAAVAA